MATRPRVIIIGAGVGGLAAALVSAARGLDTLVIEAAGVPGGKLRSVDVAGQSLDVGPTVFTLRDVFDKLFTECGGSLGDYLTLTRAERLARHYWTDGSRLDLVADIAANAAAIRDFAGPREAEGYRAFAARGLDTLVIEAASVPGGKLRSVDVAGQSLDVGPTVFTLRDVFDKLFAECGGSLGDYLTLTRAERLARHYWTDGSRLDLVADIAANAAAIRDFAGPREAEGYRAFAARAARIHATLDDSFMRATRPNPLSLAARIGWRRSGDVLAISPFQTLWQALGEHFRDPRLLQLFGRYATYCGSSPYVAPATLMLVADVEREGVWYVEGGMIKLAEALAGFAAKLGARFQYGARVERVVVERGRARAVVTSGGERFDADAILFNGDVSALPLLGPQAGAASSPPPPDARSLSAVTFAGVGSIDGAPLIRHNVFFGDNYAEEFDAIFKRGRTPARPTVYVCASDRADADAKPGETERLFCLINAPAEGARPLDAKEIERCEAAAMRVLADCGARLTWRERAVTTPADFAKRFPASAGALYGQATHGWKTSFSRPGARSRLPGLYLAGGGVHPGPGVPMAALSGRLAALAMLSDLG